MDVLYCYDWTVLTATERSRIYLAGTFSAIFYIIPEKLFIRFILGYVFTLD